MQQVTVVGAGVVGLCTAFYLQNAGFSVLLVDANAPGSGCSKGNAGHFATEQVFPLADARLIWQLPSMLCDPHGPFRIRASYLLQSLPWFSRFISNMQPKQQHKLQQALSQLNVKSLASWQKLASICQASQLLHFNGALMVSEAITNKTLVDCYQRYRNAGIDVRKLTKEETLAIEPALSSSITGCLDFTEVAHTIDPWQLSQLIFKAFRARGGEWLQTNVNQINAGPPHQIETTNTTIHTEQLVIAAGAQSHLLTRQLGWRVPLAAERGYHLMAKPVDLTRPVCSLERKFIMTPMQHGLRLAGTVEFSKLSSLPDYRRAKALLFHANMVLANRTEIQHEEAVWHGNRPSLPDSLPVLGSCPVYKGIYYNFGHQHLGLTQAAYCGEVITQLMQQGRTDLNLHPYRIQRFTPHEQIPRRSMPHLW